MSIKAIPVILLAAVAVLFLFLLIVAAILFVVFRRRPKEAPSAQPDLAIDVEGLSLSEPSPAGPQLECYGLPVQLAVLVIAPVGRAGTIPDPDQLLHVVGQLLPGFVDVISAHQPLVRFWPPQLSSQGFTNSFFHKVPLPGDRGKGTPWCSVAGKFSAAGEQFLVGLVCRATEPNGLSAIPIQHEGQWNDILRIKR